MATIPVEPRRAVVAFFDYPDVFEDFYPHYGVDQHAFAHSWSGSGNHSFLKLVQREIGDTIWYALSLAPQIDEGRHGWVGCRVRFFASSWLHRLLWKAFYLPRMAWRWRGAYRAYALVASYLAPLSFGLMAALRHDKPDFFFVQDYASGKFDVLFVLSRIMGVPLISYHAGSTADAHLGKVLRRFSLARADRTLVSSRREYDVLRTVYRVPGERMRIVLTPVDMLTFRPVERAAACARLGLPAARRYVVFMGRLEDAMKRVSAIIDAFASVAEALPDVDLLVFGDGPDAERLEKLAQARAPGRIRFPGWIDDTDEKVAAYNCAELLVLASRREGFPSVVGEALACGTPVAAPDVGAISELVRTGETGRLFDADDVAVLPRLFQELLESPATLRSMRDAARAAAERRLSEDTVAGQLRECFALDTSGRG